MAGRGKVSLYMIFLIMTFGTIGLISFQTLKERKTSAILLVAKYKEIDDLNNRYEELLEATKKSLLQAKEEKENLVRKVKDLENSDKIHHVICREDKERNKIKKEQEITALKEKLQAKDTELSKVKAKVELLKHDNKKGDANKMVIKSVGKDNLVEEGLESFVKTLDTKDKNHKISTSQNSAKEEEKASDGGRVVEERSDIVSEAKVEESKAEEAFEDEKSDGGNLEENELSESKAVEEDDAKELEVDVKLSNFDERGEANESQIQE
ncbi:hypothetical protein M758_2G144600 [Ceratodon purpureus]|nr:hypothetical protein M758_2G144600 [Ceratodon purpureus]